MDTRGAVLLDDPDALVPPAFMSGPEWHDTLGGESAELVTLAGFPPNPEQRLCLDHSYGFDRRGRLVDFEIAIIAARQNLKTGFLIQRGLTDAFLIGVPVTVWSAHEFKTTEESYIQLKAIIEACPDLDNRVFKMPQGKGDQSIILRGKGRGTLGPRIVFKARTNVGGKGLAGDRIYLDEAFALKAVHMGSLMPLMSTRRNAQIIYPSSACYPASKYLRGVIRRGRRAAVKASGADPRLFYVEWGTEVYLGDDAEGEPTFGPPPCGLADCDHAPGRPGCLWDDPEQWKRGNPALGRSVAPSISLEYLRDERRALGEDPESRHEFGRERMVIHDEPAEAEKPKAIDPETWALRQNVDAKTPDSVWAFVTVAPDRSRSTIALAGGRGKVPVVVIRTRPGVDWVAKRLRRMADRGLLVGVALNDKTQASVLLPELARVSWVNATDTEGRAACATLLRRLEEGKVTHTGQPVLTRAALDARLRKVGKAVEFDQTDPEAPDVSPLVAAAGALHRWVTEGDYDVADSYL